MDKDLGKRTLKTYLNYNGKFIDLISSMDQVSALSLDHKILSNQNLVMYRNWLVKNNYSPATVEIAVCAVKALVRVANEDFDLKVNIGKVKIYRGKKATYKGVNVKVIDQLFKVLDEEIPRNSLIVALMLLCGLRVDEVRNLTLGQLLPTHLSNVVGKSLRQRDIPLPARIKPIIEKYLVDRKLFPQEENYPLICSPREIVEGNPESYKLNTKTIYLVTKNILVKVGASRTNPHALRHTFAYRTLDIVGQNEKNPAKAMIVTSVLLGHESVNTTMHYMTPPIEDLIKQTEEK